MARRWEHSKEELQNIAIEAGYRIMEERGFQNFSARAVATRMNYTVGTLYHMFGDLDTFILHVNARTLDEWYDEVVEKMPKKEEQQARYLAHAYLKYATAHFNRWSALFEHRMKEEDIPDWYVPKMMRMFSMIEDAVFYRLGRKDMKRAKHLAKILWASVHGITTLSLAGKLDQVGAGSAERMIDDLIDLTLDAK